ncbi:hypothetical protein DQ353_18470 [Arthrobacter sp. AQ5-05]|uniref:hypothetical protein n=1 Tax=Arthrobacter sp. AQ5-05 TaxID=2184581 RepID=UPI000DCB15B3|nr:hypothetical protein [Arthrobacter sp. AQ5-05]RAX47761.1 hypothetical protein DQ353_18470 [Arthrobacter sp. AQ5-05]
MTENTNEVRAALQRAADDLIEGRVPGPLTGVRLVEVAGVKRHRLTHDNPDVNASFQERARALNRTKPEVDLLRARLAKESERNHRLSTEVKELGQRVKNYATALLTVVDERDKLREVLNELQGVVKLPKR